MYLFTFLSLSSLSLLFSHPSLTSVSVSSLLSLSFSLSLSPSPLLSLLPFKLNFIPSHICVCNLPCPSYMKLCRRPLGSCFLLGMVLQAIWQMTTLDVNLHIQCTQSIRSKPTSLSHSTCPYNQHACAKLMLI